MEPICNTVPYTIARPIRAAVARYSVLYFAKVCQVGVAGSEEGRINSNLFTFGRRSSVDPALVDIVSSQGRIQMVSIVSKERMHSSFFGRSQCNA